MIDDKLTQLNRTLERYSKRQEEKRKAEIAIMKAELAQVKNILSIKF